MWGFGVADEILGAVVWMLNSDIGITQAKIPAPFFFCRTLKRENNFDITFLIY